MLLSLISEDIHCTRQVYMYSLLADLYTEDIHCASWTLLLYQLLSPCLFSGCGFIISVALTHSAFLSCVNSQDSYSLTVLQVAH